MKAFKIADYDYLKKPRTANCQALIDPEIYGVAEVVREKKKMKWVQVLENCLTRFVHEHEGATPVPGAKRIGEIPYYKKLRNARVSARIDATIYERADEIRVKEDTTWVHILEKCLLTFSEEK